MAIQYPMKEESQKTFVSDTFISVWKMCHVIVTAEFLLSKTFKYLLYMPHRHIHKIPPNLKINLEFMIWHYTFRGSCLPKYYNDVLSNIRIIFPFSIEWFLFETKNVIQANYQFCNCKIMVRYFCRVIFVLHKLCIEYLVHSRCAGYSWSGLSNTQKDLTTKCLALGVHVTIGTYWDNLHNVAMKHIHLMQLRINSLCSTITTTIVIRHIVIT